MLNSHPNPMIWTGLVDYNENEPKFCLIYGSDMMGLDLDQHKISPNHLNKRKH